jgi:MOSC domain-containing protein YiiM
MPPGFFGENLTCAGVTERMVLVGDVFSAGSALLEVTQPRTPCRKLGLRVGNPRFGRDFLASGRTGFYLRVACEGRLAPGDELTLVARGSSGLSIHDVWRLAFTPNSDAQAIETALTLPRLSSDWRSILARRLVECSLEPTQEAPSSARPHGPI